MGTEVSNLVFSLWLPVPSPASHLLRVSKADGGCWAPVQPFWRLMSTCGEVSIYQKCWIYHMTQHLCLASHQPGWEHSTSVPIRIPGKAETQVYPPLKNLRKNVQENLKRSIFLKLLLLPD